MNATDFEVILETRIAKTRAVLAGKAKEYSTDQNRLHNFETAADELGGTPAEACWGFLKKHLVSVRDLALGVRPTTASLINEKIGDAVNYLILMEAILLDGCVSSEA